MAYTPTVWATGDTITAEKLNKAEQGIAAASAGGSLIIPLTWDGNTATLDASYADLVAAKASIIIAQEDALEDPDYPSLGRHYLVSLEESSGTYEATFATVVTSPDVAASAMIFTASSEDADMTYTVS